MREEAGVIAEELEFMGYRDVHREQDGQPTHWVAFDFRAKIDPSTPTIAEPHKCDEQRWVTIGELSRMENLHSQFPTFLEKYRDVLI